MREDKRVPIYTATKSLDIEYKFTHCIATAKVKVKAANTHAVLFAGYQRLAETRQELQTEGAYSTSSTAEKSFKNINFSTAAVTLLYTDTSKEEGYLGEQVEQMTFDLTIDKPNQIHAVMDLYDEKEYQPGLSSSVSARSTTFNSFLEQRIHSFSLVSKKFDLPSGTISNTELLAGSISGGGFHRTFHHTEQGWMHFLSSPGGIQFLISAAQRSCKASFLYGIVLDIYTNKMLCCNCSASLLGLQNSSKSGFLQNLSHSLESKGIEVGLCGLNDLMLSTRVSASRGQGKGGSLAALKLPDDKGKVHAYDSEQIQLFQAENQALGTRKIINNDSNIVSQYSGSFLTSRKSFSKAKLEKRLSLSKPSEDMTRSTVKR